MSIDGKLLKMQKNLKANLKSFLFFVEISFAKLKTAKMSVNLKTFNMNSNLKSKKFSSID